MSTRAFYTEIGVPIPEDARAEVPVRCPRADHDDRTPSASLNTSTGAWFCHRCGIGGSPYQAAIERGYSPSRAMELVKTYGLGIKPEDHDPDDDRRIKRPIKEKQMDPLPSEEALARARAALLDNEKLLGRLKELRGWRRSSVEKLGLGFDGQRITFPIRDAEGRLLSTAAYRPGERNGAKKTLATKGRPRDMFPAPETIAGDTVWIVEGEADVPSMLELGFRATSIPGVGGWRKAAPGRFAGRKVLIALDADDEGREAADKLAGALVGHAVEVRVVDIAPERADGFDVTDLLLEARRNGGVEAAQVALLKLAAAAMPVELAAIEPDAAASTLIPFTEIVAKPVRFAWADRVALSKITGLAGRPKIGKGLLYSHLIAAVTRGELDGDLRGEPRSVILVTTEDEPGDTLKPRLMAAGADLERVFIFQMGSKDEPVPFRVPQDADELARRVADTSAALVVIDPLMEFLDGKVDSHKSHPVRQAVAALNQIARDSGCAALVIFHLNKGVSTDPLLRHEGSAAFTQVVRGGLLLGHDPDDPGGADGNQRVLAVSSSNLAAIAPSLAYRIETRLVDGDTDEVIPTARMVLIGESSATSYDLLAQRADGTRSAADEAVDFLTVELSAGPKPASVVQKAARDAGISEKSLRSAREKLGIKPRKGGFDVGWEWALHEDALGGRAPSQEPEVGHLRVSPLPERDCAPREGPDRSEDALVIERASSTDSASSEPVDAEVVREHGIDPEDWS